MSSSTAVVSDSSGANRENVTSMQDASNESSMSENDIDILNNNLAKSRHSTPKSNKSATPKNNNPLSQLGEQENSKIEEDEYFK